MNWLVFLFVRITNRPRGFLNWTDEKSRCIIELAKRSSHVLFFL